MKSPTKILEITLAILLPFFPMILILAEGICRASISDYAYSQYAYVFVFFITLAGAMFLFNGFGFQRHWYNIILGVGLFGVALTPHNDYPTAHYIFAGVFFLGSLLAIQLSSNKRFRVQKNIISFVIIIGLVAHFFFGWWSLLVAEWIGIVPISIHFILKSLSQTKP